MGGRIAASFHEQNIIRCRSVYGTRLPESVHRGSRRSRRRARTRGTSGPRIVCRRAGGGGWDRQGLAVGARERRPQPHPRHALSLADALALPLAALLDGRAGARIASAGIEARLLDVSTDAGHTIEIYRLSLAPGTERRRGRPRRGCRRAPAGDRRPSARVGRLGEERASGRAKRPRGSATGRTPT